MSSQTPLNSALSNLKNRLSQLNYPQTVGEHEKFVQLFVKILPPALNCDRCAIFFMESEANQIWSQYGTGLEKHQIELKDGNSLVEQVIARKTAIIDNNMAARDGSHKEIEKQTGYVVKNILCVPIFSSTDEIIVTGAIQVLNKRHGLTFDTEDLETLNAISAFVNKALESILLNQEIQKVSGTLSEAIENLGDDFQFQNEVVAHSIQMRNVLNLAKTVSKVPVNVLISGENGTGKEVIAKFIHKQAKDPKKPFVAVNCAAIPENLMESEFFGYSKGAFTGADSDHAGKFEDANGGTLFLDEIGDLPLHMQAKFLRVLQEGKGTRLGSTKEISYNFRLLSATNRNLKEMVKNEKFREDLFYRLFSIEIFLPPLRERVEDIPALCVSMLNDLKVKFNKSNPGFSKELLDLFVGFNWPGNVRQLQREIERVLVLTPDDKYLLPSYCSQEVQMAKKLPSKPLRLGTGNTLPSQVQELEIQLIGEALEKCQGNKSKAAELLGLTRMGLYKKIQRYGIEESE